MLWPSFKNCFSSEKKQIKYAPADIRQTVWCLVQSRLFQIPDKNLSGLRLPFLICLVLNKIYTAGQNLTHKNVRCIKELETIVYCIETNKNHHA